MGFVVVSLSLGNPGFPAGDRPSGNVQSFRQLLLRQLPFPAQRFQKGPDSDEIHVSASFLGENTVDQQDTKRAKALFSALRQGLSPSNR